MLKLTFECVCEGNLSCLTGFTENKVRLILWAKEDRGHPASAQISKSSISDMIVV